MAMGIIEVGEHYMYSKYSIALGIIVVGMAWGKPRGCVHIKVSIINKEYLIWSCCTEYTPHTGNMNILYSICGQLYHTLTYFFLLLRHAYIEE